MNLKAFAANDNGGSDVDDDGITGDRYVSNLFERFAARVPARSPVRDSHGNSSGGCSEVTAAANEDLTAPDRGASEGESTAGGNGDDDVGGVRDTPSVAAAPSSPSSTHSIEPREKNRVFPAGQASPAGRARGGEGVFDGYRACSVDNSGEAACCPTANRSSGSCGSNPERRRCSAISERSKSGGAGDRQMTLLREKAITQAVAPAGRKSRGAAGKAVAGVVGVGVTPHIFEQFAYSPSG